MTTAPPAGERLPDNVIAFPGRPQQPAAPAAAVHRVTIRLSYLDQDGRLSPTPTDRPYKWFGVCSCGWKCLSWAFSRAFYASYDPAWEAEGNNTEGGALPMTLEHVGLDGTGLRVAGGTGS